MIDFVLPSLGADMDEAMLVAWLVAPGDVVEYGQVIAEVETDKGVIEVECWHDGVVEEILREPSPERLRVGTPLARIREKTETAVAEATKEPALAVPAAVATSATVKPASPVHEPTPPVRHLAHTLGVDLGEVQGTGAGESITRDDIRRAATGPVATVPSPIVTGRPKVSPRARRLAVDRGIDPSALSSTRPDRLITADRVPTAAAPAPEPLDQTTAMRQAIARSMSRSKREIPHYYLANEIDMEHALTWLEAENEQRSISDRILPAVLLLKATALAVRKVPELNGTWGEEGFRPSDPVHLGVAVSLREGGLVAPAIHHADLLSLEELMAKLRDLVARARSWRLRGSEMSDPTITVTNLGDRGVDLAFPVIIPPQVAMVGFGRVVEAVVVEGGAPAVHPTVQATLAADHRASDGHRGGLFLSALERLLQEPEAL